MNNFNLNHFNSDCTTCPLCNQLLNISYTSLACLNLTHDFNYSSPSDIYLSIKSGSNIYVAKKESTYHTLAVSTSNIYKQFSSSPFDQHTIVLTLHNFIDRWNKLKSFT